MYINPNFRNDLKELLFKYKSDLNIDNTNLVTVTESLISKLILINNGCEFNFDDSELIEDE